MNLLKYMPDKIDKTEEWTENGVGVKDIVEKINEADDLEDVKDDADYVPEELIERLDEIDENKWEEILEDL